MLVNGRQSERPVRITILRPSASLTAVRYDDIRLSGNLTAKHSMSNFDLWHASKDVNH